MSNKVELAVYDLSQGMAAQMSEAILGQRIDGIWHTGVVVFNREYFFGGGINSLPQGMFTTSNGLRPCQIMHLGHTNKTESELNEYLRSINHRFTADTYDLLTHNCNNFSDEVSRFLVGTGIPNHIIDLPRIVFSTPGGAMLRPMIEGMQNSIRAQQGGAMDPFGATRPGPPAPLSASAGSFSEVSLSQHMSTDGGQAASTSHSSATANHQGVSVAAPILAATHSTLAPRELEEKALVSSDRDAKVLRGLVAKILKVASSDGHGFSETEAAILQDSVQALCDAPSVTLPAFQNEAFVLLGRLLENCPSLHMSCLFVMRLHALTSACIDVDAVRPVFENILRRLSESCKSPPAGSCPAGDFGFSTVPGLVMAYCTLANFVSHKEGCLVLFSCPKVGEDGNAVGERHMGSAIDAAMWGLCHPRLEVRQISSALAYNLTLAGTLSGPGGQWRPEASAGVSLQWRSLHVDSDYSSEQQEQQPRNGEDELHPHVVQLLCGSMENMDAESDPTALRRRMLTAYRACRAGGEQAKELALELGFHSVVCEIRTRLKPQVGASQTGRNDDPHNLCVHLENFFTNG